MSRGIVRGGNNTGGGVVDGVIADFIVDTGYAISAGDLIKFVENKVRKENVNFYGMDGNITAVEQGSVIRNMWAVSYDTDKVFIVYRLSSGDIYGILVTINNDVVTVGSPVLVATNPNGEPSGMSKLTSSLVCVCYSEDSVVTGSKTFLQLVSISGETITSGTVFTTATFKPIWTYSFLAVYGSDTKFAIFGNDKYIRGCVFTYSGVTITAQGTITNIISTRDVNGHWGSCVQLDSTRVLCFGEGTTVYLYLNANIATIDWDNDIISAGTITEIFTHRSYGRPCAILLETNKVLFVGYCLDDTNSRACVVTISGSTISVGTVLILSSSISELLLFRINSSRVLVLNSLGYTLGEGFFLSISGTDITQEGNKFNFSYFLSNETTTSQNDLMLPISVSYNTNKFLFPNKSVDKKNLILRRFEIKRAPEGLAKTAGSAGNTISCYDWRKSQ